MQRAIPRTTTLSAGERSLPYKVISTRPALLEGRLIDAQGLDLKGQQRGASKSRCDDETLSLVALLKACAKEKNLPKGRELHAYVVQKDILRKHISIGNTLVNLYGKCGACAKAQQLFDELPVQDVVSWNALFTGYALHGLNKEAFDCFERMQGESVSPNSVTFLCMLKACASHGSAAEKGNEIHIELARKGLLRGDRVLGTALVDMYAKCGELSKAQQVFDELLTPNVVSWTALIAGYAHHGYGEKALSYFEKMKKEGFSPNALTFACVLKACGDAQAAEKGMEVHEEIHKKGFLVGNNILGTALVDMYAKCGVLTKAREVFDILLVRDIVSWNALIAGYGQHGHGEEAFHCFEQLKEDGIFPDEVTFSCILKACGTIESARKGKEIHNEIVRRASMKESVVLATALVDMYSKCGALQKAEDVFDELQARDVTCWNALMAAYCRHGQSKQALDCYETMRREGFSPDVVTMACVLKACGSLGASKTGEDFHAEIMREGLLGKGDVLGGAMVDMYARCGTCEKAQEVFDKLLVRDVVSWTALITGYAHAGKHDIVFDSLGKMIREGIEPNFVTFLVVLNSCSYLGLVEEGQKYFEMIRRHHSLTLEHHACMVDLYSRVGHFKKAMSIMGKMPSIDRHLPAWLSILGACRKWGEVNHGRLAYDHALELDKSSAVTYVCMRDIYAAAGM